MTRVDQDLIPGYRLPEVLEPYPDESLSGLIMRYTALFGFDVADRMFERLGGTRRYVYTYASQQPGSHNGDVVAAFLNLEPERFRLMSNWHPSPASMTVAGHGLPVDLTDCSWRQVCPACLLDEPYHRAAWLLTAPGCCGVHGTRLVRSCPACGERLAWRGPGVHLCQNPACCLDLRHAHAEALPAGHMDGPRALMQLFGGGRHASGMSFGDSLQAALTIGTTRAGLPLARRWATFMKSHRLEIPRLVSLGWQTLDPWPAAFRMYLDDLVAGQAARPGTTGHKKACGIVADHIFRNAGGWSAPLAAEIVDYSTGWVGVRPVSRRISKYGSGKGTGEEYMTSGEAARVLGVPVNTAVAMAERLGINMGPRTMGEKRKLKVSEVLRLKDTLADDPISAKEAGGMLGIGQYTLAFLSEDGVIANIPRSQRIKLTHAYRRADVEGLLRAFELAAGKAPVVDAAAGFRVPVTGGHRDGLGVRTACKLVLAGQLRPVAVWRSGSGLARYLFSMDDCRSLRNSDRRSRAHPAKAVVHGGGS